MGDRAPFKVVGWGFLRLPGERRRWQRAENEARRLLALAAAVDSRNADVAPSVARDPSSETDAVRTEFVESVSNFPSKSLEISSVTGENIRHSDEVISAPNKSQSVRARREIEQLRFIYDMEPREGRATAAGSVGTVDLTRTSANAKAGSISHIVPEFAATPSESDVFDQLRSRISKAIADSNPDRARKLLDAAIRRTPDDGSLYALYANTLLELHADENKIRELYERAVELSPNDAGILGSAALFAEIEINDDASAIRLYERAIEADPMNEHILANYADLLAHKDQDDRTIELFERSMQSSPRQTWPYIAYATFLQDKLRDVAKARQILERAVSVAPDDSNILAKFAEFLASLGEHDRARELFEQAVSMVGDSAWPFIKYAYFLQDNSTDRVRTVELLEKATDVDPGSGSAATALADELADQGEIARARGIYETFLAKQGPDKYVLAGYARFLFQHGEDTDLTRSVFERAAAKNSGDFRIAINFALFTEQKLDDNGLTDALYRRALEIEPDSLIGLVYYAQFLEEVGNIDKADLLYRRALSAEPQKSWPYQAYAQFLEQSKDDISQAQDMLRKALTNDPDDAVLLANYGGILHRRGDLKGASAALKRAAERADTQPDSIASQILSRYAHFVFAESGDLRAAQALYVDSLRRYSGDDSTVANAAQVFFLLGQDEKAIGLIAPLLGKSINPIIKLEIEFYWFAHVERGPGRALASIKTLIQSGVTSPGWPLGATVEKAIEDGHRGPQLLSALAEVISGKGLPEALDGFVEWKNVSGRHGINRTNRLETL